MDAKFRWLIALSLFLLGLLAWQGCSVHIEIYGSDGRPPYPQFNVILLTPTPPTLSTGTATPTYAPSATARTATATTTSGTPVQATPTFTPVTPSRTATATPSPTPISGGPTVIGGPWRVSVASDGTQANGPSTSPRLSADGRFIAFASDATNLVSDDTNNARDAFVHDWQAGAIIRVSVASDGTEGNSNSGYIGDRASTAPAISADGRYVAFESQATNLVPDDTNEATDIFVHDLQTGITKRVSIASDGSQANGRSFNPAVSVDGRYIAFESTASNLVPADNNESSDVFVHDQITGQTELVSVSSGGTPGNSGSAWPSVSADGRFVAFHSFASNLVPEDTNGFSDVFVHDRQTRQTFRVSVTSDGVQAENGESKEAMTSFDGRWIAFGSYATNLGSDDSNNNQDVFVHDRETGQTIHISVATDGTQANDIANVPVISGDGRYIVFQSPAGNLVDDDTNNAWDLFVHDRETRETVRVSVSADRAQGNSFSWGAIAPDGQFAAFASFASNLVPGDTNDTWDIFVVELATQEVTSRPMATPAPEEVVYRNDFEGGVGSEWSSTATDRAPAGGRNFLGQFVNESVSLSLDDLPAHTHVTLSFELFVINSWDGNGTNLNGVVVTDSGPDIWELSVAGGPTLLRTTFSNLDEFDWWQAYPDNYPDGNHPPHSGAAEIDTLGFTYYGNSVYQLNFTFPHTESSLVLDFSASGLLELRDESWGLDNVEVRVATPESTSSAPENDDFTNALVIETLPFNDNIDTTFATTEIGEPLRCSNNVPVIDRTVWYRFTPSTTMGLFADVDSDFVVSIVGYTGSTFDSLTEAGCVGGGGAPFRIAFPAPLIGGTTYYFQVGGLLGDEITFTLESPRPTPMPSPGTGNDHFADAIVIEDFPYTFTFDTTLATTEAGEPLRCSNNDPPMNHTIWYRFTPTSTMRLVADDVSTDFEIGIIIYTGSGLDSLTQLECLGGGGQWNREILSTPFLAGTTYYLQIGSVIGATGTITLEPAQ